MSTHRRAWMVRAGVVVVVAAAGLLGLASPALAAGEPQLSDISLSDNTISPGSETIVIFTVKMSDNNAGQADTVAVTSNNGKVTCSSTCSFGNVTIPAEGKKFQIKFRATGQFQQDEQATLNIKAGNSQNNQQLTVLAPKQTQPPAAQTVPEVSGLVVDVATGKGIPGATVDIGDSANTTWTQSTDKSGAFKITTTADKPIKPGIIAFKVSKDGIQPYDGLTKQANANQPLTNVRLTVIVAASASASAPGAAGATDGVTQNVSPLQTDAASPAGGGGGGLSWALIAVGAVLVALGVGAIVLLFVRKKNDEDPDEQDPRNARQGGPPAPMGPPGQPGRGGPRPPRRGEMAPPMRGAPGYDPTRQMRPPVSPGPRGDQTMISPSPLANAPTQLHSRIPPDHADPYGAPPPRHNGGQPGYGQTQQGPGPYGAASGGYGQSAHGANPTTPYPGGSPTQAYPGAAPTYGQGPDQYAQPGYGQAYGQGPAADPYGAPPPAYGQGPDHGGYGQEGYDQPGYDQPAYGQDGYGPAHGPRGQRPAPPPPPQPDPRRVDWLDD